MVNFYLKYGLLFNHKVKKEYYRMDDQEFERLNYLSEKSINDNVSLREMNEFKQLHDKWTKSEEFNLFVPFN